MQSFGNRPKELDGRMGNVYHYPVQPSTFLAGDVAAGGTVVKVPYLPREMHNTYGWMAIGVGGTACEVRRVDNYAGGSVSWAGALSYAHSAGDAVIFLQDLKVQAAWFGAVADWNGSTGTDNATAFSRALTQVAATGNPGVLELDGQYKIASGIAWNPFRVRLQGSGNTKIYYSATTGIAIDLTGNGQFPLDALVNIDLESNSRANSTTAIRCHDVGAGSSYMTHAAFRNVHIRQFATGISWGSYAWGNIMDNVRVYECATGVSFPASNVDSGERNCMINSMIAQCDLAINMAGSSLALSLINCSLDYNEQLANVNGQLYFQNCHIELDGTNATHAAADYQIIHNNTSDYTSFEQCRMTLVNLVKEVFKPYQARYSDDLFAFNDCKFYVTFDGTYASGRSNPYERLVLDYIDPEGRPRAIFRNCKHAGDATAPGYGQSWVAVGDSLGANNYLSQLQIRSDYPVTFARTATLGTGSTSGASDVLTTVTFNTFSGSYGSLSFYVKIPVGPEDWGKSVLGQLLINCNQTVNMTVKLKYFQRGPHVFRERSTFNSTTGVTVTLPYAVLSTRGYGVAITPVGRSTTLDEISISPGTSNFVVYCEGADTSTAFDAVITYYDPVGFVDRLLLQSSTTTTFSLTAGNDILNEINDPSQNTVPIGTDYVYIEMLMAVDASTEITFTHPWIVLL